MVQLGFFLVSAVLGWHLAFHFSVSDGVCRCAIDSFNLYNPL